MTILTKDIGPLDTEKLKGLLQSDVQGFVRALRQRSEEVSGFVDALSLNTLRKRALRSGRTPECARKIRVAVLGGCNLRPLADLIEHFISVLGDYQVELRVGDYDNYNSEIMDGDGLLREFAPAVVVLLPSAQRCRYQGSLADGQAQQRGAADRIVADALELCERINATFGAEVVLGNFQLPAYHDPGPLRWSNLGSEYAFKKYVNLELGLRAPSYCHILDVDFLSCRRGNLSSVDAKGWFESKQPFAAELLVEVARECAYLLNGMRQGSKKVLVIDLDNTIWGGVIGDDGIDGIELGTTSPRGEAFRHFQAYLKALSQRGVLLAVCSKNDYENAIEPFTRHPEMILKLDDIVSFKANWDSKADNIRQIATELNLGLDSFVFVDDNPAEIEIVRQFLPPVSAICLGEDPSVFVAHLADSRMFETRSVTAEDAGRTRLYAREAINRDELARSTDMEGYLRSLQMKALVSPFNSLDAPRIAQLINKSNQFNLTTRRRTEAEVLHLIGDDHYGTFTIRLTDRFADHGLVAVVIAVIRDGDFEIDTWLMSCRVLKRRVEEETLNEVVRLALISGCRRIVGRYIETPKNSMVRDLYPSLGFDEIERDGNSVRYSLGLTGMDSFRPTGIEVLRRPSESSGSN